MSDKQQYQAVMAYAIWKAASVGLVLGFWLGYERWSQPLGAAAMTLLGALLVHGTWRRARQTFWPEDFAIDRVSAPHGAPSERDPEP